MNEVDTVTENRSVWNASLSVAALIALALSNAFGSVWVTLSAGQVKWTVCNLVASLTQWALPSLVAVVGSIFLAASHHWNLKALWRSVIPMSVMSCVIWWVVSSAIWIQNNYPLDLDLLTFRECMAAVLEEPANISFCQMLVSFFILYPLLWRLAGDRKLMRYALILFFTMGLVEPFLAYIPYASILSMFANQLNWGYFRAWTFYLLFGAYITRYELKWPIRLAIYCAGIVAGGSMAALTSWQTNLAVGYVNEYIGFSSPLTGLQTIAVVVLFRQCLSSLHAPVMTRWLTGAWSLPPLVFVSSFFAERLLPSLHSGDLVTAALHAAASVIIACGIYHAFRQLPGFRCLVGCYHVGGDKRL